MYTELALPPEATSASGTCPTEVSLYSWSVPVQLSPTNVQIYVLCARQSRIAGEAVLCLFRLTPDLLWGHHQPSLLDARESRDPGLV